MDYPIHIDTISKGQPIVFFNGSLNYDAFMFFNLVLLLANSADTNKMPYYAAFYLGLQYL